MSASGDLAAEYRRQERWRRWDEAVARVPWRPGQRVLDLGCGVGAVCARLHGAGLEVIGVDGDEDLLAAARARCPEVRFEKLDLRQVDASTFGRVDGVWTSFVAAYFHDLEAVVKQWADLVAVGGWVVLVEVDDLLGHEPSGVRAEVERFYAAAKLGKGYDFECGRRLADVARGAGLTVVHEGTLPDDELAFEGPAAAEVLEAWRARMARMRGAQAFFGERWGAIEAGLLAAMASPAHRVTARVVMVVAQR